MISRLASCRRGAVSLDAAIVFPVLIALAMGVIEFGMLIFTDSAMQTATREAARQMLVNFTTPAAVDAAVRARLPAWSANAATVAVSQSAAGTPETKVFTVVVTMPAGDATPVRFFASTAENWDLRTEVVMKQELPL